MMRVLRWMMRQVRLAFCDHPPTLLLADVHIAIGDVRVAARWRGIDYWEFNVRPDCVLTLGRVLYLCGYACPQLRRVSGKRALISKVGGDATLLVLHCVLDTDDNDDVLTSILK